jgi:hypothetical protein
MHENYAYFPTRIFPTQASSCQNNVSNTWEVYEEWGSRAGYMRQFIQYNKLFPRPHAPVYLAITFSLRCVQGLFLSSEF